LLPLQQNPNAGMHTENERHHNSDGAHGKANHAKQESRDRTRPPGSTEAKTNVPQLELFLQVAISDGEFKEAIIQQKNCS
jgi:hypothetical protein